MMARPRIYTPEVCAEIRAMMADGASRADIAAAVGTTKARLSARLSHLGIKRGPVVEPQMVTLQIRAPMTVLEGLRVAGEARRTTPNNMARVLLTRIIEENLLTAVLDDED
jgi:hypothetical protein